MALGRDIRYAIRTLLKTPSFTAVAVVIIALGIAANTALFSAVDAVLLHPLPFAHPEQLVSVSKTMPKFGLFDSNLSPLDFVDIRAQSQAFSQMGAIERAQFNLTGSQQPERVPGTRVSASLFGLLGVSPILGRTFSSDEEQWDRHRVVILSEPFWKSHFGGDRSILGKTIQLDSETYTVIGVLRPTLTFLGRTELWAPEAFQPSDLAADSRGHQFLQAFGRLRPGVTLDGARSDLKRVATQMTKQAPNWYPSDWSVNVPPLAARVSGPIQQPLLVLVAAVALVLLIGCANVANLLLGRASARQKEITIRAALGATRQRLIAQLLVEGGLIASTAGALGLLCAVWLLDLFERFGPTTLLAGQHLQMNTMVAGFTLLLSVMSTMIFGLAPAVLVSRTDLETSLREASRSASGAAGKQSFRSALVACEVALSLTLLICAGLLLRSFGRLLASSPGFATEGVAAFQINLPAASYRQPSQIVNFYSLLLSQLSSLRSVTAAGATDTLPFSGSNRGGSFNIIGRPWAPNENVPDVDHRQVSPGYFQTMRIPLLRGRTFTTLDGPDSPKVAVADEPFVRRFFPREDPIGKQISGPSADSTFDATYTIAGVVSGVKHRNLFTPPAATIYYPALQVPARTMTILLRTAGADPLRVVSSVRAEVAAIDRNLPVSRVATMEQYLSDSLLRTRFSTTLLSAFAGVAVLLAAIGVYGVISYAVVQRNREIGIRMALGAEPRDALRLILRQSAIPVFTGLSVGLVASLAAARALASLLYEISATDPLVFFAVPLTLAFVALAASYIPARRAARIDPIVALRYE